MPLTPDQHPPDAKDYEIRRLFVRVNQDKTVDVYAWIDGSLQVTVAENCDINKVSQRTGGDEHHVPGVSSPTQVDAPIEDHGTGGPKRPADEQPPPDMTGGGQPIRGGGKPGKPGKPGRF